jgi:hypothetical protein
MEENTVSYQIEFKGTWSVSDGKVTVKSPLGSKTTQIGGSRPEGLAEIMLRELYDDMLSRYPTGRGPISP